VNDVQVSHGVHPVLHMCDVNVLKRTAHVVDAVDSGDVGQEGIAEALTLSSTSGVMQGQQQMQDAYASGTHTTSSSSSDPG